MKEIMRDEVNKFFNEKFRKKSEVINELNIFMEDSTACKDSCESCKKVNGLNYFECRFHEKSVFLFVTKFIHKTQTL